MALLQELAFYLLLGLGVAIFFKLDKRLSIVSRLLIAGFAVIFLVLLFVFISAIVAILLVVIAVILLVSFFERKRFKFRGHRLK